MLWKIALWFAKTWTESCDCQTTSERQYEFSLRFCRLAIDPQTGYCRAGASFVRHRLGFGVGRTNLKVESFARVGRLAECGPVPDSGANEGRYLVVGEEACVKESCHASIYTNAVTWSIVISKQ